LCNGSAMLNWRIFFSAFLGRIVGSLFVGICIVLGFGPTQWAEFLISGLPVFITPGIARLGLLLIASIVVFLEWRVPVRSGINNWSPRARQSALTAFVITCCLPFVIGAFYVTAHSTSIKPDRHLNDNQKETLSKEIGKIPPDQLHDIIVAAVDDPEALQYAIEFIYFFKYYSIPTNESYIDPPDNKIPSPYSIKEFGRSAGISLSVHDPNNPPKLAEALRQAMRSAGFSLDYERFHGPMPAIGNANTPADFMLSILYN